MTVLITLSVVGSDAGPSFNLYSSSNGTTFTSIIDGITKTELEAGYTATVPDGTTSIKVTSASPCATFEVATLVPAPIYQEILASAGSSVCGYTYVDGQKSVSLGNSLNCPYGLVYPFYLYTISGSLASGEIVYYYSDGEYVPYDLGYFLCLGTEYQSGDIYVTDSAGICSVYATQGEVAPEYVNCTPC